MVKYIKIFLVFLLGVLFLLPDTSVKANQEIVNLYVFHAEGCLYCAREAEYLERLQLEDPNIRVYKYEIAYDKEGQAVAKKVEDLLGIRIRSVPLVIIGRTQIVGFSEGVTDVEIEETIAYARSHVTRDIIGEMLGIVEPGSGNDDIPSNATFRLPFFGEVSAQAVSLPLLSIVLGTLDGFNPCAMWVLLLLLSMLIHIEERWKRWTLGLIFLITSAVMYFFFMLSWLNITMLFGSIFILRLIIGSVAIGGGGYNVFKGLQKDDGCEVVDEKQRKKLRTRIQKISSNKTFFLSAIGIMGLAITVNLVELICSAGLPIVFTQILALNQLQTWQYIGYLLLYVTFFLIDDLVVFFIAMKTMELTGISTKYSKYSHLIGGGIMVVLGILMIFKFEWLMFNF